MIIRLQMQEGYSLVTTHACNLLKYFWHKHQCPAYTKSAFDKLVEVGALAPTEQGTWDPKWNSYSLEYFYYPEEEIVPNRFMQFYKPDENGNDVNDNGAPI